MVYLYTSAYGLRIDQNLPVVGAVSVVTMAGLIYAYSNSLYTSQVALHRADRQDSTRRTSGTASEETTRAGLISAASAHWALASVNAGFFLLFTLLSLGTTSGMPAVYKYVVTSLVPPAVIAFLTQPSSA
ncbi:hypothetical protein HK405_014613 [Cladochytrium tenue]|nr:hypothetical protein HK405_014613 [Cladochytrium tenue]